MRREFPHIILASQSPRRSQLLSEAGVAYRVVRPSESAECGVCSRESPPELVSRLAYQKARDVACRIEQGIIVGCDTVAVCQGQILGKPIDRQHAKEMLRLMRGREHQVYSGVCVWSRPLDCTWVEADVTTLRMDPLSDAQLDRYLDTDAWQGKAGAFGYQDGLDWVHILKGSESNVVGLPMELLERMLQRAVRELPP